VEDHLNPTIADKGLQGLAVENQQTLPRVEAKRTEGVEASYFLVHSPGKEFFKISSRFRKDF
jgi:hypothetical protein